MSMAYGRPRRCAAESTKGRREQSKQSKQASKQTKSILVVQVVVVVDTIQTSRPQLKKSIEFRLSKPRRLPLFVDNQQRTNHVRRSSSDPNESTGLQGQEEGCSRWAQIAQEKGRCIEGMSTTTNRSDWIFRSFSAITPHKHFFGLFVSLLL